SVEGSAEKSRAVTELAPADLRAVSSRQAGTQAQRIGEQANIQGDPPLEVSCGPDDRFSWSALLLPRADRGALIDQLELDGLFIGFELHDPEAANLPRLGNIALSRGRTLA